ncbi:hypothetical protein AArcCO_1944 [Halalkaliarchaeum sp. AArc-CO]|nr:hypothetical protein AArcCO_1944 [Halalkaliarchaeum sp. AArc-CO]
MAIRGFSPPSCSVSRIAARCVRGPRSHSIVSGFFSVTAADGDDYGIHGDDYGIHGGD